MIAWIRLYVVEPEARVCNCIVGTVDDNECVDKTMRG